MGSRQEKPRSHDSDRGMEVCGEGAAAEELERLKGQIPESCPVEPQFYPLGTGEQ